MDAAAEAAVEVAAAAMDSEKRALVHLLEHVTQVWPCSLSHTHTQADTKTHTQALSHTRQQRRRAAGVH